MEIRGWAETLKETLNFFPPCPIARALESVGK